MPFLCLLSLFAGYCYVLQLVAVLEDRVVPRRRQIPERPILMLGRRSLTLGRRLQMIRYTLCMTCRPLTCGNRDLSDQEIFEAFCSRDDSRDGIEGPVTSHCSQESVDSKWPTPKDAALPQPGSLPTPQSSWQTYTERATQHGPWVCRRHVPGPPHEPLTLKPYVPEIINTIQASSKEVTATLIRQ